MKDWIGEEGPIDLNMDLTMGPDFGMYYATIDGQTTAHYIADQLDGRVTLTSLAQGVPIGGELDYLDDGTITAAMRARKAI